MKKDENIKKWKWWNDEHDEHDENNETVENHYQHIANETKNADKNENYANEEMLK